MAFDWISLSPKLLIKPSLAISTVSDARISLITASKLSMAIKRPSRTCARFWASDNSYFERRTTTSWRCSTKCLIMSLRFSSIGRPFTKAILFTLKLDCSWVYLYSLFKTTFGTASRLHTYTMRIPLRSDSSRMSAIPSSFFSSTKSAVFLIISALFTWYGISVTIMQSRPLTSSMCALARSTMRPRPVSNASRTPS